MPLEIFKINFSHPCISFCNSVSPLKSKYQLTVVYKKPIPLSKSSHLLDYFPPSIKARKYFVEKSLHSYGLSGNIGCEDKFWMNIFGISLATELFWGSNFTIDIVVWIWPDNTLRRVVHVFKLSMINVQPFFLGLKLNTLC